MRTMKPPPSIFTALLFLQISSGDKSCEIWSSAGRVVHRHSSFKIYCTLKFECRPSMFSGQTPRPQHHQKYNSTTIYLNVVNLTEDRTFSCDCETSGNTDNKPDPCGMDISVGYPPDVPTNVSCVYKVDDRLSKVVCSWDCGRNTYLKNTSILRVRKFTHNASGESEPLNVSANKEEASFLVASSVRLISVQVHVENPLKAKESAVINYTLSNIMMPYPPEIHEVDCLSRNCTIKVTQRVPTFLLDFYCKENNEEEWTLCPDSVVFNGSVLIKSLKPFRQYQFRAKSSFRTGVWSDWSKTVSSWTQEEAPARALDVWYAVDHNEKFMRIYWKELQSSFAQGKILEYIITVFNSTWTVKNEQNVSVPLCTTCEITVCARNSKGHSPLANITIHTTTAEAPIRPDTNNQNVTISWRKSHTAPLPLEYVVEWYPKGQRLDELRWVRMGQNSTCVVITDLKGSVCYEGAVYVFHRNNSVSRHEFSGVNIEVSRPTAGPSVHEREEGSTVNVTWSELPMSQRGGCITKYTIYLENSTGHSPYNVSPSQRFWVFRGLVPAAYSIWMTASTAKGEGEPGQKVKFFIRQDSQMPLIITCGTMLILGVLFCACQSSFVKERVCVYFQYCRPEDIPDPANSKWVKEYPKEKGKLAVQLQLSTSTVNDEEDLVFVDVVELPQTLLCPQTSLNSDSEPSPPLYPQTTYIKSFSHDSYSSGDTQTSSLDTNETVDYISSHGTAAMSEEEDMEDVHGFFPSHSFSMEPMDNGPKLTLDAVRIDGNDFFLQCDG